MLQALSVFLLAHAPLLVSAQSPSTNYTDLVLFSERPSIPTGYTDGSPASNDTVLSLRIGLAATDRDGLENALYDASTPGSANYGHWLDTAAVTSYFAPSEDSVNAVTSWLDSYGVTNITRRGTFNDWFHFSLNVSTANALLNTTFNTYDNPIGGDPQVRTLRYYVPQEVAGAIKAVHPTTTFFPTQQGAAGIAATPEVNGTCDTILTPSCLKELYGLPDPGEVNEGSSIGVAGYTQDYPQYADLKQFLQLHRPDLDPETKWELLPATGGQDPQNASLAGRETNLDTQYTIGVASNIPETFIAVGQEGRDSVAGFLEAVDFLNSLEDPPLVITQSFGFDEDWIDAPLAKSICDGYMALTSRGVSIMFASGDGGVGGLYENSNPNCTSFHAVFPTSCPFVTSVGATQNITEKAANFSGGGFSTYFDRPKYQESAVSAYFSELGDENKGLYNENGRGYPDVSAQGVNAEIVSGGNVTYITGASVASPIFASTIALVNDRLLSAGKPPLGFLNPWIYSNPGAFSDIEDGSNPACGTNGFHAASGWDPISGYGTPNFPAMLEAVGL